MLQIYSNDTFNKELRIVAWIRLDKIKYAIDIGLKCQFFLTIQFILATFMGSIALFGIIYGFHDIISITFQFYLQNLQQKVFSFNYKLFSNVP